MFITAKRLASVAATTSLFLNGAPGLAAIYQAICSGGSECTVTLANGAISINYVDAAGSIQLASVGFRNNVPANQFMMEMMGMTALSMGQVNSALQTRIEAIKSEAAEKARIAALNCARTLKTYGCSWSAYLDANPAVKTWASKYPGLVPSEKLRLGAID